MPKLCLRYANDMPEICPRFDKISKTSLSDSVSNVDPRDISGSKKIEDNDDDNKESFP